MYVCMYVCIYVCMCVCVCVCVCIYIYIYIYIYILLRFPKAVYKSRTLFITLCDIKEATLHVYDGSKILGKTSGVIFFICMYTLFLCVYRASCILILFKPTIHNIFLF